MPNVKLSYAKPLVGFVLGYVLASARYLFSTTRSLSTGFGSSVAVPTTSFDTIARIAFDRVLHDDIDDEPQHRAPFVLAQWVNRTRGGLSDEARLLLAEKYSSVESIFEFGLGESTFIANHVGVSRYAGIDSDATWVDRVRAVVDERFRFYLGDIGEIQDWGVPLANRSKAFLQYQVAPLMVEPLPFEIYMVDGRWRRGCFFASFLHASARGSEDATVLIHDCHRYEEDITVSDLFELDSSQGNLCAFKRKATTTDRGILESWMEHYTFSG